MTSYSILITLVGGESIELPCVDKEDYDRKSKFLEELMPEKNWRETRIP